jgi:RND family efflux transporter MFP subunit
MRPAPFFTVLCLAALALITGCQKPAAKAKEEPPSQDAVFVTPVRQTVAEYEEFPGRTWAVNTVDVRARVSGYLKSINFKDGELVKEGDVLVQIDDRSFKAELARAKASIDQFQARFNKLKKQEDRAAELLQSPTRAITPEEFEAIVADKEETLAFKEAAIAAKEIAELNLSYTEVKAPISGRISRRLVDAGNLVTADSTILATIVTVEPIYVYFDMDERTVLRMKRLLAEGKIRSARESNLEVQIAAADESKFDHVGVVDFVDNQLDPATGTLRFRAEVKNDDRFFTPGMFVRLRFPIGEPHYALLVPEEAIATDQGRRQVFVINDKNQVEARPVETGILQEGLRVIREGIGPDDRVVVTGLQHIKKNKPVNPVRRGDLGGSDDAAKTASTASP